jgi:hypothetical protein
MYRLVIFLKRFQWRDDHDSYWLNFMFCKCGLILNFLFVVQKRESFEISSMKVGPNFENSYFSFKGKKNFK